MQTFDPFIVFFGISQSGSFWRDIRDINFWLKIGRKFERRVGSACSEADPLS